MHCLKICIGNTKCTQNIDDVIYDGIFRLKDNDSVSFQYT